AVINLLEKYFPGKVVQHDPFTSVAAGLAIANYFDYRADIPKSSFEYP
ncbi:MAG: putative chaperone protein, partial [Oceanicoccus sp.]